MLNIIFMGTPDFARDSLEAVYKAGHTIKAVITVPDRPKGRGMKLIPSEVKEYAISKNFNLYQPDKLKGNDEILNNIKKLNPDIICVVAYGKIIPKEILDLPKFGCINVHPSLLPKYRGAAPIQSAIINGDEKTGVTTMYLNEKMDEGDMLLKKEVKIGEDETLGEVWDKLSTVGANLLVKTIEKIEDGTIKRIPQDSKGQEKPTYAPMLDKSIAQIDWEHKTAKEIKNLVRGLNPIMGAYTFINNKKIKIWKAQVLDEKDFVQQYEYSVEDLNDKKYGDVLIADSKKGLFIKAKEGIISVLEIQAENARKMDVLDFLRGNKLLDIK